MKFNKPMTFTTDNARLSVSAANNVTTLKGYAIIWNQPSVDMGGYKVIFAKGSVSFANPCHALYHHNFAAILGSTENKTLRILASDDTGIPVEIDLPNTTTGRDVAELCTPNETGKARVNGMSFRACNGFEEFTEEKGEDGILIITCTKATCDECTVTAIPAFTATTIEVMAKTDEEDEDEEEAENAYTVELAEAEQKMAAATLDMLNL